MREPTYEDYEAMIHHRVRAWIPGLKRLDPSVVEWDDLVQMGAEAFLRARGHYVEKLRARELALESGKRAPIPPRFSTILFRSLEQTFGTYSIYLKRRRAGGRLRGRGGHSGKSEIAWRQVLLVESEPHHGCTHRMAERFHALERDLRELVRCIVEAPADFVSIFTCGPDRSELWKYFHSKGMSEAEARLRSSKIWSPKIL